MWIAENWTDYEVIDCSLGEKLERWGDYILLRPDPQVIWDTPKKNPFWHKLNAHYHRSKKGGGEWEFFNLPEEWSIERTLHPSGGCSVKSNRTDTDSGNAGSLAKESANDVSLKLTFRLKPFSFKHTGLFPEQAVNWEWFSSIIYRKKQEQPQRRIKVLNLFAYTGGATLAAAAAGAEVTHVDASKGMVGWAKENAAASGLSDAPVRWLVDDCKKFVEREIRRGNHYDGIIMDPPSYGRGPKGEIWKIEDAIFELITLSASLLSEDALFFLVNSYTTGLQPAVLHYMISSALAGLGGTVEADEIGLPVTASGLYLPCGASGRWNAV